MIAPLLIRIKIGFQIVREKEQFQYQEHDCKLNKYDRPQFFTHGHALKTLVVKLVYVSDNVHFEDLKVL